MVHLHGGLPTSLGPIFLDVDEQTFLIPCTSRVRHPLFGGGLPNEARREGHGRRLAHADARVLLCVPLRNLRTASFRLGRSRLVRPQISQNDADWEPKRRCWPVRLAISPIDADRNRHNLARRNSQMGTVSSPGLTLRPSAQSADCLFPAQHSSAKSDGNVGGSTPA